MEHMSKAEYMAFLAEGTRTGKIATVRADGRPHVVPVWFVLDGDALIFTTWHTTVKASNLRRDPRACFCVDVAEPPYHFVMLEGQVEFLAPTEDNMVHWTSQLGARYMGQEVAEAFGKRNAVEGELLLRFTPEHVVAIKNMAD